ncbi:MAG TPA: NlpC/P60 family protein, partial [Anaerolineae bacterium]|nr:NlpC/P60 family protein [Anaerolineae bacterium]
FGISAETILWANDLDAGATLQPGQELTILPVSGVLHTVRKGDTLNGIAEHYGVEPATIIAANSVASPDALSIDQTLIIPGGRPLPPPTPVPAAPLAPEATSAPVSAEATGKGAEIVAIAQRYLGYAYVYGGASPAAGFDCSGFTQYVYGQAGLSIARGLSGQLAAGPSVSRSELLPGDLVFFQGTYQAGLSHVGIYVGDGMMIHASSPERGVCYDDLDATYWVQHYYGACRAW